MKHLEFVVEEIDALSVLVLRGFLDLNEVIKFERQIDRLIKNKQINIILDLTQLTYISSAGLGSLVSTIRELRNLGGDLKIGGLSDRVKELLETFGFSDIFDTFLTREEAIMKFKEI